MAEPSYEVRPVGRVESPLTDVDLAPRQGDEGAPDAWVVLHDDVRQAMRDLVPGSQVVLLTWLHRARRDVLAVHPRDDVSRDVRGVFSTRSADRPNPIGLHVVRILAVDGPRIRVAALEAVDGTPVLDLKPVLEPVGQR